MAEERVQRRLAAILAADVVGYSRLMREDEAGTRARFNAHLHELIEPAIANRQGRIVKTIGDGLLVEFASVVDAVQCAVNIQKGMAECNVDEPDDQKIVFRIGVNLGDVIIEGDDIHGDGVNVAARLEGLCEPGEVFISGMVHDNVEGKLSASFEDLGEQHVKNINKPVRVYRVGDVDGTIEADKSQVDVQEVRSRQMPVVAVLPFDNISGDTEQEYFADGMTEDIITLLSKYRWLQVIARNTTFGYKGKSPDIRLLAKELGANYVVEGSVRRSEKRLRVSAQLIDTQSGVHIWAERYDRDIEDIFVLQDEITSKIVARAEPELGFAERHRVDRMPRTNLQAWDCYHLGMAHFFKFTAEDNLEAQRLFERSIELDDKFGEAHAWWGYSVILGMVYWDTVPDKSLRKEALDATRRALYLDNQNAAFYFISGRTALACGDYSASLVGCEEAINLNPTFAAAHCAIGDALAYQGRFEQAFSHFEKAVDLSPNDPQLWSFLTYGALAFILSGDFEKALSWTKRASILPNHQYWTTAHMAVAFAYLGRDGEAKTTVSQLLAQKPEFSVEFARQKLFYLTRPEQVSFYLEGLRKAGFPEQPLEGEESLPLPDKPSIAVLPFENMSGDPEQEYFTDGMTEDLITDLSKISGLFVIARNSSFAYKGKQPDVRSVGRELGVRHVLEGSVRRAGDRVRINAQLIDASTGGHLWAERYDGNLSDIFDLQDEIGDRIISALQVQLTEQEIERQKTGHVPVLEAYDHFIRGRHMANEQYFRHSQVSQSAPSSEILRSARDEFQRAMGIDPKFAGGYAGLSWTYSLGVRHGLSDSPKEDKEQALRLANLAVEIDENFAWAHTALGSILVMLGRHEEAIAASRRAVELQPSDGDAQSYLGFQLFWSGMPEQALLPLEEALRLDPRFLGRLLSFIGIAKFGMERFDEAAKDLETAISTGHVIHFTLAFVAAAYWKLGRVQDAKDTIANLLDRYPNFTVSKFDNLLPYKHNRDTRRVCDLLQDAGLPE